MRGLCSMVLMVVTVVLGSAAAPRPTARATGMSFHSSLEQPIQLELHGVVPGIRGFDVGGSYVETYRPEAAAGADAAAEEGGSGPEEEGEGGVEGGVEGEAGPDGAQRQPRVRT